MTPTQSVGIYTNVPVELILRNKKKLENGAIMEMVIWRLPETDPGDRTGTNTDCITGARADVSSATTTSAGRAITATSVTAKSRIASRHWIG